MSEYTLITDKTNEVLRVTADGQFIWHPDANRLIEEGDFTGSPSMQHILRALIAKQEQRNVTKNEHDVLMKALAKSVKVVDAGFLAKQKQGEPVAWMSASRFEELRNGFTVMTTLTKQKAFDDDVSIYTTPQQRKPLTDEECDDLWDVQLIHITDKVSARQFIRDIEAAHGIKE